MSAYIRVSAYMPAISRMTDSGLLRKPDWPNVCLCSGWKIIHLKADAAASSAVLHMTLL